MIEVVDLHYAEAAALSKVLATVFSSSQRITGPAAPVQSGKPNAKKPVKPKPSAAQVRPMGLSVLEYVAIHAVEHANQLLLVGTVRGIEQVKKAITRVDVFGSNLVVEVIELEYADAEVVAETLRTMFSQKQAAETSRNSSARPVGGRAEATPAKPIAEGGLGTFQSPLANVDIQAMGRTNQLIIKAAKGDVEIMRQLVARLDIYVEPMTQAYQFIYVDASELYTGLERILNISTRSGSVGGRGGQGENERSRQRGGLTLVERNNSIVVTGPPSVQRIMQSIVATVDTPGKYEAGADIAKWKWFHAKLVIQGVRVKAYVNHDSKPVLVVDQILTDRRNGQIGIWAWNAYFANFRCAPACDQLESDTQPDISKN